MSDDSNRVRTAGGQITEDPLRDAPVGARLQMRASLFEGKPNSASLSDVANWDFFQGAVVSIHFGAHKKQRILGSGVLVAPGIVMTARHVVEPQEQQLRRGEQEIICSGITTRGLVLWRCRGVTLVGNTDIALLMVEAASELPEVLHLVTLTTRMPRIGENTTVVGMRHLDDASIDIGSEINLSMKAAVGRVTARYEQKRDRALLSHPCFEVDCAAIGGMSGGPAFDNDGFLLGVIATSLEGDAPGPTFLTMPWPAFAETINPIWPSGFYKGPTSLLQIDPRVCGIHRRDAIEVHKDESGQFIATYHHWDSIRAE